MTAPSLRKRRVKGGTVATIQEDQHHEEKLTTTEQEQEQQEQQQQQQQGTNDGGRDSSTSPNLSFDEREHDRTTLYRLTPLIQVGPMRRLDVGPFALLFILFVLVDHFLLTEETSLAVDTIEFSAIQTLVTLAFAVSLLCHVSLVVGAQWSIPWKVAVGFKAVAPKRRRSNKSVESGHDGMSLTDGEYGTEDMLKWTHCYVQQLHSSNSSSDGGGSAGIAPVHISNDKKRAIVQFQDHVFRFCPRTFLPDGDVQLWKKSSKDETTKAEASIPATTTATFRPLFYPINLPLGFYASWNGHSSISQVTQASSIYGLNQTIIRLPSFWALLSEQLIAPFFLFQAFCVILWSLDEYWYYAIFTLCALLMFESTLAYNRQQSLQRLHQAGNTHADQRLWVRRPVGKNLGVAISKKQSNASWILLPKAELVPGDYVSVSVNSAVGTPVPADIVILHGTAVCDEALLTGESVPQLKQALDTTTRDGNGDGETTRLDLQDNLHKESILFGGTKLLVANADTAESLATDGSGDLPPDRGVTGMVLRTGFETAQGNLLRTMAHSTRIADGIHTWDTFVFILLLVGCALAAAAMVLREGWHDERRNRFRLGLHVIIIVTSVVPPELPMELSLAVTNSVAALVRRCKVYCSELFRIPWAGEVNVCCFDKTGTLTSDEMRLRGVRLPTNDHDKNNEDSVLKMPSEAEDIPRDTIRVMIACHSLTPAEGSNTNRVVLGDPLEQAILHKTGYRLRGNNVVVQSDDSGGGGEPVTILHRFAFSSKLKRMTVLATEERGTIWALSKGAPETMKHFLTAGSLPTNYDATAFYHMSHGRRVLAMACRRITVSGSKGLPQLIQGGREQVEKNLDFVGFLVLDCPLKPDSKSVISELSKSGHYPVMITGDALLTAVEVARQVGIVSSGSKSSAVVYRIQPRAPCAASGEASTEFECVDVAAGSEECLPLSQNGIPMLRKLQREGRAAFSISGDVLVRIAQSVMAGGGVSSVNYSSSLSTNKEKSLLLHPSAQVFLSELVPLISVFARHAPHQKEAVVAAFNHGGFRTLMVGDGTNDVGALKRAHVGISIISAPVVEAKQRDASDAVSRLKKKKKSDTAKKKEEQRRMLERSLEQLREAQEELDFVELGDASVAAPFTSRSVSIRCVKDVIQQGRCTLVTMLQIYKILGINCLVNAMVLSNLFLHGVKQGDQQLTILGIAVASLFFFVTRAEPLSTLSVERPPSSVLCAQALVSIALQFTVHMFAIYLATKAALLFVDPYDPSLVPDGPFNPNVLNSSTFLLTCVATINTFAVNYRGRPFMDDLHKNKLLYRSLQACYSVLAICALQVFPPLNDLMQLTALPDVENGMTPLVDDKELKMEPWLEGLVQVVQISGFSLFIFGLMVADTVLAFAVERLTRRLF